MNKAEEFKILKEVYSNSKYNIVSSEQPDFLIEYENKKIGVEITEMYFNESQARIVKDPNYLSSILKKKGADKAYKHKDDKDNIQYSTLYVANKLGKYEKLCDAIEQNKTNEQIIEAGSKANLIKNKIIETMQCKNGKASKYQKCDYLDLVIKGYDISIENLEKLKNNSEILALLEKSKFMNVYLIVNENYNDYILAIGNQKYINNTLMED